MYIPETLVTFNASGTLTEDLQLYGCDGALMISPASLRNDMLTVG